MFTSEAQGIIAGEPEALNKNRNEQSKKSNRPRGAYQTGDNTQTSRETFGGGPENPNQTKAAQKTEEIEE